MYQLPKTGILLWRTAHDSKGPDCIFLCIYFMNTHHWKIMLQAVISQVVTKRTFGFIFAWIHFARDHKVGICADCEPVTVAISEPSSAKYTRKGHLTDAFRQWHHCSN